MPPTRVGVVGAGFIAGRHAETLGTLPDVAVVGVCDPQRDRAVTLARRAGASAYPDVEEMLRAARPDAVYVCVPPNAHGGPERAVLARGLGLFVEKPLGVDLALAEALAGEVDAAGVPNATGYHWRYMDTVEQAVELLAGRPPRLLTASWLDRTPGPPWWPVRAASGGQLVEQATHLVDLARHLVGEVESVSALGASCGVTGPDGDVDEASAAILAFANGAVGTLTATCLFDRKDTTTVEVVAPGLALMVSESELVVTDADGIRRREPGNDARVAVDREFIDVVRGVRARTAVPYEEALRTHRVACALAASAEEGTPVGVSPA